MSIARISSVGLGRSSIPQTLQIAKSDASRKLCSLREAIPWPVLHTANMADQVDIRSGNLLRAWREFRRITQEELASRVGTTGAVISLLEAGERKLSPKWLYRLAPALETTPGYLLDHHPEDIPRDIFETWANIPRERQEHAREVLQTFRLNDRKLG